MGLPLLRKVVTGSLTASLACLMVSSFAGCSGPADPSSSASPDAAAGAVLEGVYATSDDGPITQLDFVDATHVTVSWADCGGGQSCAGDDSYALDPAGTALTITDAAGKVTVLEWTALGFGGVTTQALRILGGGLTSGDAGSLTGGDAGALSGSGTKLVASFSTKLTSGCVQLYKKTGTFANDRAAFDFFRSKGLTAVQAAGVVGNLDQESGNAPGSVQPGGPGRGIAQWSKGERWDTSPGDNLASYAAGQHLSAGALQTQLDFIWYELSTYPHYGLASLKQTTTMVSAAQVFASDFEACGTCDQTKRDAYGQAAYNAFASDPVAGKAGDGGADGGTCSAGSAFGSCTTGGASGSCIDTGACKTQGGTSTAGKCPGPSNVECCTM